MTAIVPSVAATARSPSGWKWTRFSLLWNEKVETNQPRRGIPEPACFVSLAVAIWMPSGLVGGTEHEIVVA